MKYEKAFSKTVTNGKLIYIMSPVVPLPLKVRSVTLFLGGEHGSKKFVAKHNGAEIASGVVTSGQKIVLDPPIQLSIGRQTFLFAASPFKRGEAVEGRLLIETSIW